MCKLRMFLRVTSRARERGEAHQYLNLISRCLFVKRRYMSCPCDGRHLRLARRALALARAYEMRGRYISVESGI